MITRKSFVAALVALAAAAVLAPYWMGVQTERTYRATLQRAAGGPLGLRLEHYRRGWFSSRAVVRVTLSAPVDAKASGVRSLSFELIQRIDHGPLPWRDWIAGAAPWRPLEAVIRSQLVPGSATAHGARRDGPGPRLRTVTLVGLEGASDTRYRIPPFRVRFGAAGRGLVLDWQGLTGSLHVGRHLDHSDARLIFQGLTLSRSGRTLRLAPVRVQGRGHRGPSGFLHQDVALSAAGVRLSTAPRGQAALALDGVTLRSRSAEAAGELRFDLHTQVRRLDVGGTSLGPGAYDLSVRHLDSGVMARFQRDLEALRRRNLPSAELRAETARRLRRLLPALMRSGPVVEIPRLSVETAEGRLRASARVTYRPTAAGGPWWGRLQGRAHLTLPRRLARRLLIRQARLELASAQGAGSLDGLDEGQLPRLARLIAKQRLEALTSRGYLQCAHGLCQVTLRCQGTRVSLNGHPLPLVAEVAPSVRRPPPLADVGSHAR